MGIFDDGEVELDSLFEDSVEPEPEPVVQQPAEPEVQKTRFQLAQEAAEKFEKSNHIKDGRRALKRAREAQAEMDAEIAVLRREKRTQEAARTFARIQGFKGDPTKLAAVYVKAYPDSEVTPDLLLAFARTLELA